MSDPKSSYKDVGETLDAYNKYKSEDVVAGMLRRQFTQAMLSLADVVRQIHESTSQDQLTGSYRVVSDGDMLQCNDITWWSLTGREHHLDVTIIQREPSDVPGEKT